MTGQICEECDAPREKQQPEKPQREESGYVYPMAVNSTIEVAFASPSLALGGSTTSEPFGTSRPSTVVPNRPQFSSKKVPVSEL